MMSRLKALLLPLPVMIALAACSKPEEKVTQAGESRPVPVRVGEILERIEPRFQEVTGTVEAKVRATLEAKTSGRVEKMPAQVGQSFVKGDLLVVLDVQENEARMEQARATYEQAALELKRLTALLKQEAVTQADFDAAQSRFRVAEAGLKEAETILGFGKVTAPFDGVVARTWVEVGDLAAPGKPLVEIHDPKAMQFVAQVPDSLISGVELGSELQIEISKGSRTSGKVVEIAPSGDPVSRTFRVEIDLSGKEFRPGSFGRLLIPLGKEPLLLVPESALVNRGQLEFLIAIKTNHAQLRLVKTGRRTESGIEILSGVAAGEQIVIEDPGSLRDGQLVSPL